MFKVFTNFRPHKDFDFLIEQYKDKPITLFNDYIPKSYSELQVNPYNFIIMHEPNEFFRMHDWVIQNRIHFTGILAWNDEILNQCENSILFCHNARQTSNEYVKSFETVNDKKFEVSFLCGVKQLVEGHQLRHTIHKLENQIKIPKKWFYVLDDFNHEKNERPLDGQWEGKKVCYNEPMFHICIENVKHNNWYTEKIGEAFCTKTLPIYWGCPNINDFYDPRGIITFNTPNELIEIVNNLTPQTYYDRLDAINFNYKKGIQDTLQNNLTLFFDEFIQANNI